MTILKAVYRQLILRVLQLIFQIYLDNCLLKDMLVFRRNSGIPSSIYRPPDTIYDMEHCYWYGDL